MDPTAPWDSLELKSDSSKVFFSEDTARVEDIPEEESIMEEDPAENADLFVVVGVYAVFACIY